LGRKRYEGLYQVQGRKTNDGEKKDLTDANPNGGDVCIKVMELRQGGKEAAYLTFKTNIKYKILCVKKRKKQNELD